MRILVLLATLAAVKVSLLAAIGPVQTPDSDGYVQLALMLADHGLPAADPGQSTLYRILGYPAFLAACRLVAGEGWPWLAVAVQAALSLVATAAVHRLARRLGLPSGAALLAAFGHATALALVLDQCILADSLHASLYTLVLCALAGARLAGRPLRPAPALAAGLALAAAFLLREVTLVVAVGLVPLALAAASAPGRRWRTAATLAALAVPLLLTHQAYKEWNRARLGVAVVTTVAHATLIQALTIPARHDPGFFDRDQPLDRAARATFRDYSFAEVVALNRRLATEYGIPPHQQAADAYARYFSAWRERPVRMLAIPLEHLRGNQAQLSLRPVESLRELLLWSGAGDGRLGRWRAVREGAWWQLPLVALDALSKAVSVVLFAAFALGVPWLAWSRRAWAAPELGLWVAYAAVVGAYGLVHLETRYVAPVQAAALVGGMAVLAAASARVRRRRTARAATLA